MDFRPTDAERVTRRAVREFAEREIAPHVLTWDEAQRFPLDLLPKLAELGLLGIQFPERYDGAGMSAIEYCICIEELARVDPAIALTVAAHLYMFSSEPQRARLLTWLARGETLGAWGLTEQTAGSDAGGTRTTATPVSSGWVLNGAKTFTTHGSLAGITVVMAVTDPSQGQHGISAFFVEQGTSGMTPGRKENKLGMRASDTAEVRFEDCQVSTDALLGAVSQGFVNALEVLDAGRIGIVALSVGLAQGAFEAVRRYAADRRQFGQPIASF